MFEGIQLAPAEAPVSQIQAFSDSRIGPSHTHVEKYLSLSDIQTRT